MIKAVLFDLDGTLADSLIDLADGVNRAIQQKGYPTHPVEAFKYFVGDGIPKMIERALPPEQRSERAHSRISDCNACSAVLVFFVRTIFCSIPFVVLRLHLRRVLSA